MYTVFTHSAASRVCHVLATHDCRFVGFAVFQNATCTHHTHASVGHVIFNVTLVVFVAGALLFMTKSHPAGDVVSLLMI